MHAPRTPLALALAAALAAALPGAASAQARHAGGSGLALGALVGFEDGSGDTGLALRGDVDVPLQALAPMVRLSFVGSLGYSRWTYHTAFFSDLNSTLNIFKLTPAVRFHFGQWPAVKPYADAGLGLHYARFSVRQRDPFGNVYTASDSDTNLHMRFAGGIVFPLAPTFGLGAEIDLTPYFGNVDNTSFSLLFAAVFRA